MILDIDAGNTRFKWRIRSASFGGSLGESSLSGVSEYGEFGSLVDVFSYAVITRVCLATVVQAAKYKELIESIATVWSGRIEFVQVVDCLSGLKLAYNEVSLLGVDRWLAMLSARDKFPETDLLVVDSGSALTLDLVSSSGVHFGGYIVPGFNMSRNALFDHTDRVKVLGEIGSTISPGNSTQEAVDHGVLRMLSSFLADVMCEYKGMKLVITGGDGEMLAPFYAGRVDVVPELVLDGIAQALP